MVEIITWDRGDTIRMNITFSDIEDVVYDPSTIDLKIYDPLQSLILNVTYSASEIKRSSTGVYYYDYDIPGDALLGTYISKWIGVAAGFNDTSRDQFEIVLTEEKLYCTVEEVWNRGGIDDNVATRDEVIPFIRASMSEIDSMMGRTFTYGNSQTDWFDTNRDDYYVAIDTINLRHRPIINIISLKEYDVNNNLVKTIESGDYWVNLKTGRLTLLDSYFTQQKHRVEVKYLSGYDIIPYNIRSLCSVLSTIRLFIHQIGGTYDDVTNYSTCGLSVGVGEPYVNILRDIEKLDKESTRLIASIGRLKPSCIVL